MSKPLYMELADLRTTYNRSLDRNQHLKEEIADLLADLARAHERTRTLTDALRYIEWVWDEIADANLCPSCRRNNSEGHDENCYTAEALAVSPPAEAGQR